MIMIILIITILIIIIIFIMEVLCARVDSSEVLNWKRQTTVKYLATP